jgi:hypothetical protein
VAWNDYKLVGFAADLPVTTPGYFTTILGCVPTDRGIGSGPIVAETSSTAINTTSTGGALLAKTDATGELIVGTATKLYGFDLSTTLTDRSAAAYNASTTNTWSVTQFGNIALAANLGDQLQQRTIGAAANFASVGAAPVPKASIVVTCGPVTAPFVMVFDYADGTNTDRDGWKCSAISDYTGWTSGTNSCATGRLLDNVTGPITAAIPYRDGVIAWKRRGMYIGEYTGPPNIWSWRRISSDVGCIGKNACAVADDVVYFSDDSCVWQFDGSYPRKVPGSVQKYWADTVLTLAPSTADRNYYRVVFDKEKHLIWFTTGTATAAETYGLAYNFVSGFWTQALTVLRSSTGVIVRELLSARYMVSISNLKVGTLSWGSNGTEPKGASILGWALSDRVNTPIIKGIRPHWSIGPTLATSGWVTGTLYALDSERSLQPGSSSRTTLSTMSFRQPGKLDGVGSAEIMTFSMVLSDGITWEMTGLSIDVEKAGRS